jgi:hypothetical protein
LLQWRRRSRGCTLMFFVFRASPSSFWGKAEMYGRMGSRLPAPGTVPRVFKD